MSFLLTLKLVSRSQPVPQFYPGCLSAPSLKRKWPQRVSPLPVVVWVFLCTGGWSVTTFHSTLRLSAQWVWSLFTDLLPVNEVYCLTIPVEWLNAVKQLHLCLGLWPSWERCCQCQMTQSMRCRNLDAVRLHRGALGSALPTFLGDWGQPQKGFDALLYLGIRSSLISGVDTSCGLSPQSGCCCLAPWNAPRESFWWMGTPLLLRVLLIPILTRFF